MLTPATRKLNFTMRTRIDKKDLVVQGPLTVGNRKQVTIQWVDVERELVDRAATVWVEFLRSPYASDARVDRAALGRGEMVFVDVPEWFDARSTRMHLRFVDGAGLVVAWAERIEPRAFDGKGVARKSGSNVAGTKDTNVDRPDSAEPEVALIAIQTSSTLGGEVWRLDYNEDGIFVEINEELGSKLDVAADPVFRALVVPQVVRRVLSDIYMGEATSGLDVVPEHTKSAWRAFAEGRATELDLPNPAGLEGAAIRETIDGVCGSIAARLEAVEVVKRRLVSWGKE